MPIAIDTETTGLDPRKDRLVEIGAVCLDTGAEYHVYCNPGIPVPADATAVHGLTDAFLATQPPLDPAPLLAVLGTADLVAHNAAFDAAFLRAVGVTNPFIDTLAIAKQKHPLANNTLDGLCRRYGISIAARTTHGALVDARLLAAVYPELIGRQATLDLAVASGHEDAAVIYKQRALPPRITPAEIERHAKMLENIPGHYWPQYGS